jgi:DNA ligase-1
MHQTRSMLQLSKLVDTFESMEETKSRLALTELLVSLIKNTSHTVIDKVIYLIQGKLRPDYEGIEMGIAEKMIIRALSQTLAIDVSSILETYRQTGDLGDTTRKMLSTKKSKAEGNAISVDFVYSKLYEIAKTSGVGSQELKIKIIVDLLTSSTPREARYIIKFITGTLRLGVADNTVMDALAVAFTGNKSNRKVLEEAYNVCSDLGTVAKVLASNGIEAVKAIQITIFKPIRPMLAERVRTAQEGLKRMEGGIGAAEYKLDGERIQVHVKKGDNHRKGDGKVELFSRRLENITYQYPDVARAVISSPESIKEAIVEGEVVAIDSQTLELRPFQELMHRRRKHGIDKAIEQYPVLLNIFDILYLNGKDQTSLPYSQRRKVLEEIIPSTKVNGDAPDAHKTPGKRDANVTKYNSIDSHDTNHTLIQLIPQIVTKSEEDIERYMSAAIENGCEGIVLKQLSSVYKAGSRGFLWTKLKREYKNELADTLDLVIVGGLYGRGRRVGKYGALLLACYDHESDMFRSISKVGAGFTDIHLEDFYNNLERHRIKHRNARVDVIAENMDVWFEPSIVIEVIASEITVSPSYSTAMNSIKNGYGLALRFPKFTGKIRDDKSPEDATTVDEIIKMYKDQIRKFNQ